MHQIKYGTILLVLATLQGCATNYIPVEDKSHIEVLQPSLITVLEIDWTVYAGMQCLTQNEFKNLAENMSEVKRYIKQSRIIIREHNKLYDQGKLKDE